MSVRSHLCALIGRIFARGRNARAREEEKSIGMNTGIRQVSEVFVIHSSGKLVRGEACIALGEQVAALLARGQAPGILLNLEAVSYIDDVGLATLIKAWVDTRKHGGVLKLVCPEGKVLQVLRMTHLDTVFEVFPTEAQAMSSFNCR